MELNLEGAEENQEQAGVDLFVAPFCHLHLVLLVCVCLSDLSEIRGNFLDFHFHILGIHGAHIFLWNCSAYFSIHLVSFQGSSLEYSM